MRTPCDPSATATAARETPALPGVIGIAAASLMAGTITRAASSGWSIPNDDATAAAGDLDRKAREREDADACDRPRRAAERRKGVEHVRELRASLSLGDTTTATPATSNPSPSNASG